MKYTEAEKRWLSFSKSFKSPVGSLLKTQETASKHEEWRFAVGYEGLYEVSSLGRLRAWWRGSRTRYVKLTEPRILSQHDSIKRTHIYRACNLRPPHGGKTIEYIHFLVLSAFVGPRPSRRHEGAHFDGNGRNNDISNLRWATHEEQYQDQRRLGRANVGEKSGTAVLKEGQVLAIRRLRKYGISQTELSKKYGVGRANIAHIEHGRRWKHLPK